MLARLPVLSAAPASAVVGVLLAALVTSSASASPRVVIDYPANGAALYGSEDPSLPYGDTISIAGRVLDPEPGHTYALYLQGQRLEATCAEAAAMGAVAAMTDLYGCADPVAGTFHGWRLPMPIPSEEEALGPGYPWQLAPWNLETKRVFRSVLVELVDETPGFEGVAFRDQITLYDLRSFADAPPPTAELTHAVSGTVVFEDALAAQVSAHVGSADVATNAYSPKTSAQLSVKPSARSQGGPSGPRRVSRNHTMVSTSPYQHVVWQSEATVTKSTSPPAATIAFASARECS